MSAKEPTVNFNDIQTAIVTGLIICYLIGIFIGWHAYLSYHWMGDPEQASDAELIKHFVRLGTAISFRKVSMVMVVGAVVWDMFFRTDSQFNLKQYWLLGAALLIGDFITIPLLERCKKFVWAIWVLRRGREQGLVPKE